MRDVNSLSNQSKKIYLELLKLEISLNNKNSKINIFSSGQFKIKKNAK